MIAPENSQCAAITKAAEWLRVNGFDVIGRELTDAIYLIEGAPAASLGRLISATSVLRASVSGRSDAPTSRYNTIQKAVNELRTMLAQEGVQPIEGGFVPTPGAPFDLVA